MADFVNRTTKELVLSGSVARHPLAQWIQLAPRAVSNDPFSSPSLSAVVGQPSIYWKINGDNIELQTAGEQAATDAQLLSDGRDAETTQFDDLESYFRALVLVLLDEINALREEGFGGLYRDAAVTSQSVPNNVWTALDALSGSSAMAIGGGVIADTAGGQVTLPRAGDWDIG